MLVLKRREQQSIIIGDRLVTITILGIDGKQVRLGIEAPKHISVHRNEVLQKIEAQRNAEALEGSESNGK